MVQGFPKAIEINLMSRGANYHDQAILSMITYPYLFKILFAPFLDTFFFSKFGKSKTYICVSGILTCTGLVYTMFSIEDQIKNLKVKEIATSWFVLNLVIVFFQISAESWTLTLLKGDQKAKGSIMLSIGLSLGYFVTVNLFVPLNSKDWLNEHIYYDNPITEELLSNRQMIGIMAVFILAVNLYVILFVAEKKISPNKEMTCGKILTFAKRFITNRHVLTFLLYLIGTSFFTALIDASVSFKFIENGFNKADLINIETITTPLAILVLFLSPLCMFKNYLLRARHFVCFVLLFCSVFDFWTLLKYIQDKRSMIAFIKLLGSATVGIISEYNFVYWYGFLNTILEEESGATSITIFTSLVNASYDVPNTLGLKLVDVIDNYKAFGITCYVAAFVVLIATFPLAAKLDKERKRK